MTAGMPAVMRVGGGAADLAEEDRETLSRAVAPKGPAPLSTRPAATHPWRRSYKGG